MRRHRAGDPLRLHDLSELRASVLPALREQGFRVSPALPHLKERELRPLEEIAKRLVAIRAVAEWVCRPDPPSAELARAVADLGLDRWLGDRERQMLDTPRERAYAAHGGAVGWLFEGAWSLAWVLGFEPQPSHLGEMMADEDVVAVVLRFTPSPVGLDPRAWLAERDPQPEPNVVQLEDVFYCVHNAVRSAQLGGRTVPPGFHPVRNGGVIHERRKALTWCLSPGVSWDDTDVST